jgi:hypothetical protein
MYRKIHRWIDEDQEIPEAEETNEEPRDRYDFELQELRGHRIRDIESDDD